MKQKYGVQRKKGFTLIESIVFLFIFSVISLTFFQAYVVTLRTVIESKNRMGATALANQKMEIVRSIEYDDIGTKSWSGSAWVYGIPAGELIEEEEISVNTTLYHVDMFVQYVDDTFDGVTPADTIPTDYKRIRVTVSWGNRGPDQQIALFGNFSPNGIETSAGGGVLSINVLDAAGNGISNASVRIQNSAASIDTTATTDGTGNVTLPGAPAGTEAYTITVSKNSYFGATTFPAYPTTAYNPVDVHASVVVATLNQMSIVMDRQSDIRINTVDPFDTDIPNIDFTLIGGRILGTDPVSGNSVLQFSSTDTTDSSGESQYDDQSYGEYTIDIPDTADYEFWKMTPEGSGISNTDILPGVSADLKAILLDKNIGSLKVTVRNSADNLPLAGVSVKLTNSSLSYDTTLTTDVFGTVYFPTALPGLVAADYDIEVSASGFITETDTVTIGSTLVKEDYDLVAN